LITRTKSEDQDDWIRELTITMNITFLSPSKQLISICITDPVDPLFLYQVDIGEQEFHFLKQELSLLIEFQHFPQKFFEMLELCSQHGTNLNSSYKENINDSNILNKSIINQYQSNYICILHHNSNSSEALLIIHEITQFRQLNHLILRFKSATDSVLKKYLANLVKEYKTKSETFSKDNSRLTENLENSYREIKHLKDDLKNIKTLHYNELENFKLEHFKEINETKEKLYQDCNNKLETKENEKNLILSELENKISELKNKLESVTQEKLNLEDLKIKLEARERDLEGKNTILNSELKVYKDEVENLRNTSTNLNQNNFNQEKTLTEFRVKNELIIQQLEDKEKNVNNLTQLVENLNKQKSDIEDYLKSTKNTNNKLEDKLQASISEINKGNEIIQKLQVISYYKSYFYFNISTTRLN
jgi:spindle assembly abnormal protein 6